MPSPDHTRVTRKCPKACERCRSMKVKCSGRRPCARCERQSEACVYAPEVKRVLVAKSYLLELQRANRISTEGVQGRPFGSGSPAPTPEDDELVVNVAATPSSPPKSYPPDVENVRDVSEGEQVLADACVSLAEVTVLGAQEGNEENQDDGHAVSESHTQRQSSPRATTSDGRGGLDGAGDAQDSQVAADHSSHFQKNPPMDHDPPFRPAEGRLWYLAPSSSWAFCRRVLGLLGRSMPPETDNTLDPFNTDGQACRMEWQPLPRGEAPDVSDLPPLDYSLFLFHASKYYFGIMNYLIDEKSYLQNLHELYQNPAAKASTSRLWYAQHLLVLAFGKAFVSRKSSRGKPAGHIYAVRAMTLLPSQAEMGPDPLLSVQVLILAAVYLQSVDMRVSAFQYIGQASRLCVCIGMHRHMPEGIFGADVSKQYNLVFWVAHIIDTELSALMGSTATIQNEQITAQLPDLTSDSLEALSMSLHVRLSRLMATILTTVYGVGSDFDGCLARDIQSNLRTLAQTSTELHALLDTYFHGSIPKASRTALRLMLSYHHCVVLTTRPLVMCALHLHLERANTLQFQTLDLRPPVSSILQSCVDSARTILRTLCILSEEDLLESFMPFDLEDAFSSAFLLYILRDISPSLLPDHGWRDDISNILQHMVDNGSVVAPLRQRELHQLEATLASITPRFTGSSLTVEATIDDSWSAPGDVQDPGKDLFMVDCSMGPSSNDLLDWAQQLDMPDFLATMDYGV